MSEVGVAGAEPLLADLRRIVRSFENDGWFWDEANFRELHPVLLESVCRVTVAARMNALAIVRAADTRDPEKVFAQQGYELTAAVKDALTKQREHRALSRAVLGAGKDCPFWVVPETQFAGRQTMRNKWALSVESGGLVQLRHEASRNSVGGGGNSRLLLGRGFGDRFSFLTGIEFGGGALLQSSSKGQFTINYFPAIPLVFRLRDLDWLYDLELAPAGLFQSDDTTLSYGARVGVTVGVSVLRTRSFLPWAGVALVGEHYFPGGGRESAQFLRGGLRVGIRWLP